MVCPSYLHCERFNYARQSYGGMNPTIEENVRKGLWRMEYDIPGTEEEEQQKYSSHTSNIKVKHEVDDMIDSDNEGGAEYKINVRREGEEDNEEEGEIDSEEEDRKAISGPVYGSIIGTIGRKFNRNNNKKVKSEPNKQGNSSKNNNNNQKSNPRKRKHEDPQDNFDGSQMSSKKKKKGFWKNKNKQKNRQNNNSS